MYINFSTFMCIYTLNLIINAQVNVNILLSISCSGNSGRLYLVAYWLISSPLRQY